MQFLMHLNEDCDSIRGQTLLMDPLLSVSKACLMIERIEQQKQVTSGVTGAREIAAAVNRTSSITYAGNLESNTTYSNAFAAKGSVATRPKRDNKKIKSNRFCGHCLRTGHTIDQCFKLVGYPDWYDAPKDKNKGKGGTRMAAHAYSQNSDVMQPGMKETPLEDSGSTKTTFGQFDSNLLQTLAQEMMKLMKGKQVDQ